MSLAVFDVQVHEVRDLLLQVAADLAKIRESQTRIAWATNLTVEVPFAEEKNGPDAGTPDPF